MPLKIIRNDITRVPVDVIVNSANPKPKYGTGTDYAIYQAAGAEELLAERKKIGNINVGDIAVTPAFNLDAKYIIHTVGPVWFGGNKNELKYLRSCYRKSLEKAAELGAETTSFPLISTGVYMFPRDKALNVAMSTITEFLFEHDMTVYLVVFDKRSFQLTGKIFQEVEDYIDDDSVFDSQGAEYRALLDCVEPDKREEAAEYISRAQNDIFAREMLSEFVSRRNYERVESWFRWHDSGHENDVEPDSLERILATDEMSFRDKLFELIDKKGLTDPEVYKKANIDRKLFSKIRCNADYTPRKNTIVALAFALELDREEMHDLLGRAGIALSPGGKFDKIVEYCVDHRIYDVHTINMILFDNDQETLGG
ncbi:MAG: macro domain-containing protein [Lachnospiraceae bacterium]|nr:macro domain-containing protein [Lachnospiraceae bacterium]